MPHSTTTIIASVVNALVTWRGERGMVERYDPLGTSMCDVLLQPETGESFWVSSHECKRLDGSSLPSRREILKESDRERKASLLKIRADHIRDWHKPWPGMEFGKAHFGQMIDAALKDIDG